MTNDPPGERVVVRSPLNAEHNRAYAGGEAYKMMNEAAIVAHIPPLRPGCGVRALGTGTKCRSANEIRSITGNKK